MVTINTASGPVDKLADAALAEFQVVLMGGGSLRHQAALNARCRKLGTCVCLPAQRVNTTPQMRPLLRPAVCSGTLVFPVVSRGKPTAPPPSASQDASPSGSNLQRFGSATVSVCVSSGRLRCTQG